MSPLLGLAGNDEDSGRSMTVPGMEPITAMAVQSAIDDPTRFRCRKRRHASGEVDWNERIS